MNVNDGLLSDTAFKTILGISAFFLCIALFVDWTEAESPDICLDKLSCFKHFIEIINDGASKTVALISLTILGIYATIFRSHQTGLTLRQAISNNTFNNYMEHKKQFNTIIKDFNEKSLDLHVANTEKLYRKCFPSNNSIYFNPEVSSTSEIFKIVEAHNEWVNRALDFCPNLPNDLTTSQDNEHDEYISLINDLRLNMWKACAEPKKLYNISEFFIEALNSVDNSNINILLEDPVRCINSYHFLLEQILNFCMLTDVKVEQLGLNPNGCPLNVLGENIKEQDQDFISP